MSGMENQKEERSLFRGMSQNNLKISKEEKEGGLLVRMADFILRLSFFFLFLGIPLFFLGTSFQGIAFEKQYYFFFWFLVALISWAFKSGYLGEMKIRKTPLDFPLLAFWLVYVLATIFSADRWHSLLGFFGDPSRGLIGITALIMTYYLILSNFNKKNFRWILSGILMSGSIVIIWTLAVVFNWIGFLPDKWLTYFPINTIGSMGGLTLFLGAFIPILMMEIFRIQEKENSKFKKPLSIFWTIFIFLDILAIFSLYSYAPWLAILVGVVLFLVFILAKIVRPRGHWTFVSMASFFLILVALMVGRVNIAKVNLPINVSVPYETSLKIAKESIKEKFFLGYGSGNYGMAFSKNFPVEFDNSGVRFFQDNGIVLEAVSSVGVLGAVVLIVLILTFLGVVLFLLSRDKEKNKLISLGLVSSMICLLAGVVSQRTESSILIYTVLLGAFSMAVLYLESNVEKEFFTLSLKASPKFALTLAFIYLLILSSVIFLFVFLGKIFIADIQAGSAVRESSVREDGSVAKMYQAVKNNPRESRYYMRLGQEYMSLTNQEMLKPENEQDVNKIQNYLSLAIQFGKVGESLAQKDVQSIEGLASLYENSGLYIKDALKSAEDEYRKASELEPNNPDFYIKLGQIKLKMLEQGDDKQEANKKLIEESKELFQKAISVRKNYPVAYYNLAIAQENLGQLDEAIENMQIAINLQRNNANFIFNLARLYQTRGKENDGKMAESLYKFNLARLYQTRGKENDGKMAESLYKQILSADPKEINTHFGLATLYEKESRKEDAISELEEVKKLLPENSEEAKQRIEKMIQNIKSGIPNTVENLRTENPEPTSENVVEENAPTSSAEPLNEGAVVANPDDSINNQ